MKIKITAVLTVMIIFVTYALVPFANFHTADVKAVEYDFVTLSTNLSDQHFGFKFNAVADKAFNLINHSIFGDYEAINNDVRDAKIAETKGEYLKHVSAISATTASCYATQAIIAIVVLIVVWLAYLYVVLMIVYNAARAFNRKCVKQSRGARKCTI